VGVCASPPDPRNRMRALLRGKAIAAGAMRSAGGAEIRCAWPRGLESPHSSIEEALRDSMDAGWVEDVVEGVSGVRCGDPLRSPARGKTPRSSLRDDKTRRFS
jgi:hypothetical protein